MQKKRPRGNGGTQSGSPGEAGEAVKTPAGSGGAVVPGEGTARPDKGTTPPEEGRGRRARVRNRLVLGVALVGVTVVAAGSPAILRASEDLNDAQNLANLAALDQQAITLSQSLADERDEVVVHIAAGRDEQPADEGSAGGGGGKGGKGRYEITKTRSARVDRQIEEIRAGSTASAGLLRDLATVPSIRRTALTGKGSALEAYRAYSEVIAKLQALADQLAERTPAEAADSTRAPAALGRAVEQASATRGLLLAALAVPKPSDAGPAYDPITGLPVESGADADSKKYEQLRDELSAEAQKSRVRELAALADFDQSANAAARESLTATVTGPEVKTAEAYLTRLTDRPELSDSDREADPEKVESALSSRIDQMRGVQSGLGSSQVERLEKLRDDEVTALELSLALLGGCLVIAVGVSTAVARTLTRPLAVVRIGAARIATAPATEEPLRFTGRNDEFAQVVRSVNQLHGQLLDLSSRAEELSGDRTDLIGAREKVASQRAELQERTGELAAQLQRLRHTVHHTFVNLSLRNLGLVERQLGVIEGLEDREQDPERLATLFKLDHLATVMRRHSENLLVLAGHEHGHGSTGPVPLVDVLRAAVSEIERYERVTIQSLPAHAQVAGFAADDLSHLVAELLENATAFSPPDAEVQLSGWTLESGEVVLSVQDQGIGMSAERLAQLNARLAEPEGAETYDKLPRDAGARAYGAGTGGAAGPGAVDGEGLGLRVAALLAARHGVEVELREHQQGGVAAVVVLPSALLPTATPPAVPHQTRPAGAAPAITLPGSAAEANSNALPGRPDVDPMVVAAEAAILKAETEAEAARAEAAPAPAAGPAGAEPDRHDRADDGAPETTGTDQDTFVMRLPAEPAGTAEAVSPAASPDPAEPLAAARPAPAAEPAEPAEAAESPAGERVTDKGLPKRTPRILKPTEAPTGRTGSVDAEALRRRLGGFHQGAIEGRRDVEAELTEREEHAVREEHEAGDVRDEHDRRDEDSRRDEHGRGGARDRHAKQDGTAAPDPRDQRDQREGEQRENTDPPGRTAPPRRSEPETGETGDTVEEARS
ncbi:nitrate- and nitrite sensing domain-containing protein [Streptomyces sp. NPDC012623]|uniref:sensor histidine kinase n=1 Tax=unclassified Streptomyces TaxID=2593676 RepID=UPI0036C1AACB